MTASAVLDDRARQGREWAARQLGRDLFDFSPASADASFRRYFRLQSGAASWVLMDAPPQREDCRPFIDVAGRLAAAGLRVPAIIGCDLEQGFLLLDDLGRRTYLQILDPHNADALFQPALRTLVRMQVSADARGLPPYDEALLRRELALFPEWYLGRERALQPSAAQAARLRAVEDRLVASALAQPRVLVHRDFMPRNLMGEPPAPGQQAPAPGVLDFQDAVQGPLSYDAVCLFRDAFLSWPEDRVEGWLRDYWRLAGDAGLPVPAGFSEFRRAADWMGAQRHLKVIGIFARIAHRDGKPAYLADVPRFFGYLRGCAARYPELADLAVLFDEWGLGPEGQA